MWSWHAPVLKFLRYRDISSLAYLLLNSLRLLDCYREALRSNTMTSNNAFWTVIQTFIALTSNLAPLFVLAVDGTRLLSVTGCRIGSMATSWQTCSNNAPVQLQPSGWRISFAFIWSFDIFSLNLFRLVFSALVLSFLMLFLISDMLSLLGLYSVSWLIQYIFSKQPWSIVFHLSVKMRSCYSYSSKSHT